jgi:predicted DNA-binding transcriptional regulator YafY
VLKAGTWYMAALAPPAKDPRIYRLSNIQTLSPDPGAAFRRPKKFDLAGFWRGATERFEQEIYRDQATLRVSPRSRFFSS